MRLPFIARPPGTACGPSARRKNLVTMGVQAMVLDQDRKLLLVRHGYRPGWHFPGGGVERNETLASAMARELEEETAIVLTGEPSLLGIYAHFEQFPGDHIVVYLAHDWVQPRVPVPNREIAELGFFAADNLPDGTSSGSRRRINEVFHKAPQTHAW